MCHNYPSFKAAVLMESFIRLGSLCPVHYLVFAELMALPWLCPYLLPFRIGFYVSRTSQIWQSHFPSALVFGGNTNSFLTITISGLKLLGEGEFAEEVESVLKGFYRKMEIGFPLLIFGALSAADRAQPHPCPLRGFSLPRFPEYFREGMIANREGVETIFLKIF